MSQKSPGCRSCLVWMACIFTGLAVIVGIAAFFGYRKARGFIDKFAQPHPVTLPVVQYSKPELDAVQQRIDEFLAGARLGRTNARLALSANDLNALLANSSFSNRVYVSLASNNIAGRFSVPFDEIGMPLFSGRYLNGSGTLDVGSKGGRLAITLKDASVDGVALPEHYVDWIRKQNFARNVAANPAVQAALEHVGRIGVSNGQLVFEVQTDGTR